MTNVKQNKPNKVVAVYMRVSTANQEQEETIGGQWIELRDRIKIDGAILPETNIYKDEGWSGALIKRPELDRLRGDAKIGKFEVLYIYDKGRLSRKFLHQELILEELQKSGIKVIELHGSVEGENCESKMFNQMMGVFHDYERTKITERMRLGKMRIVKENKELLGYIPCFGYDLNKTIKTGANRRRASFSINKKEAEIVKYIFELSVSGCSMYQIRKQLKKEGIKSPRGSVWGNNTLRRMLTNETYIGKHYYNKLEAIESEVRYSNSYKRVVKNSRRERPKEEWSPIEVEPIISKELFMRAQQQLEKNKRYNPRRSKNQYLLTGLIHCSCGRARSGDPGGKNHTYYRCTDRLNNKSGDRKCYSTGINSVVLDDLVWKTIKDLLSQPELISKYAVKWKNEKDTYEEEEQKLNDKLKTLEQKRSKFIDALGNGVLTEDEFMKKADEIKIQANEIRIRLSEIECERATKPNVDPNKIADSVVKLLVDGISFEEKRAIIRQIVVDVIADPKEATIIGKIPITNSARNDINLSFGEYWETIDKMEKQSDSDENYLNLTDKEIGYKLKNRHCRTSERREIDSF